jgi:site-specific DNA-methyltransferase (adenine-specific)
MELIIKLIQYSSNEGDLIADFFLGGFSTAKAALGMNRSIIGFEINSKSFHYHIKELSYIKPGCLLESIKKGKGDPPPNVRKRWTENEKQKLYKRFDQIYRQIKNKRQTIQILEKEFGRGYFAILRQLDKSEPA